MDTAAHPLVDLGFWDYVSLYNRLITKNVMTYWNGWTEGLNDHGLWNPNRSTSFQITFYQNDNIKEIKNSF